MSAGLLFRRRINLLRQEALMLRRREQIRTRNDVRKECLVPTHQCSWSHLFANGNDEAFISAMGVNKRGFDILWREFRKHYEVKYLRGKGGRPSTVTPCQALGMLLQFYASEVDLKSIALLHGVPRATASKTLLKAELALNKSLQRLTLAKIKWPSKAEQRAYAARIEAKYPNIKGRFGFVDGKNFRVQEPSDTDTQNALYNGWLHSVLITGVLCFSVDGLIIWAKHNCVGSWNDGDMSRELQEKLLCADLCEEDHGIVADTAFPVSKGLRGKIISPLKENELERAHPLAQAALLSLSNSITSLRQACEWGVGSIEKVWRQLLRPLPYNPGLRRIRLTNLFRLWNFRVRTTGISQIRNVFLL